MKSDIDLLQRRLGYSFSKPEHLNLALTHRSYGSRNNERLEFLGDSILNFTIAEALYDQFPDAKEGILTRLRAQLVREETLAEIAREMGLGDYLRLGGGELKSGGFRRASILADTVEAIIGAIYLDAGMEACRERLLVWFKERLQGLSTKQAQKDPKTCLQEYLQSRRLPLPRYELVAVEGQAHAQMFTSECHIDGLEQPTTGVGTSRRIAEQKAAREALTQLGVEVNND